MKIGYIIFYVVTIFIVCIISCAAVGVNIKIRKHQLNDTEAIQGDMTLVVDGDELGDVIDTLDCIADDLYELEIMQTDSLRMAVDFLIKMYNDNCE